MNVKTRALLVVCSLMLLMALFFVIQGISDHDRGIRDAVNDDAKVIDSTFEDIQRYSFLPYHTRLRQLVRNNPAVRTAFADRDRDRLARLTAPLFRDLREENGHVQALDYHLPDGAVFLRMQDPRRHGDHVGAFRPIVQAVHEGRAQLAGFDVGRSGLMYWIVEPVFENGRYAGALELGIQAQQLVLALADRFASEATIVVHEDIWKKAMMVREGYRRFGDYVVTMGPGSIYSQLPDGYDLSHEQDAVVTLNERPHKIHLGAALRDHADRTIARILLAQDLSDRFADKQKFIRRSVLVILGLLSISFTALYASFRVLIGRLETSAEENRRTREEVEQARHELEARVRDRTRELAAANASLSDQHRFLQTIIESLTHPFYVIDAESYRILLANRSAYGDRAGDYQDLTCYQMTHRRTAPCSGTEHPCAIREVKSSKQMVIMEHVHTGEDGQDRINEIYAYPIMNADGRIEKIIEYCIDITDRRKAEDDRKKLAVQLNQMQKMEAIGALAGGIAHDFNNILAAMLGFADLARRRLAKDNPVQDLLAKVLEGGERATKLVRQILTFSRQADHTLTPVKVQDIVHEALRLLRASIPTTIEFLQDIDPDCGEVLADPTSLHQIIMNLCTNSYHAMREKGGVLGVKLTSARIGTDTQRLASSYLPPGEYVKLEVSDTGHGMGPEVVKRIFDPYFTTKGPGEGTGLGLAVVHGIVKGHGGQVTVYSEPGVGTTFNVYLPRYRPVETLKAAPGFDVSAPGEALPRGNERILLVDDEAQIAEMETELLESLGYRVRAFNDSMTALKEFQEQPGQFDLVITDMTMPKMTGAQLARHILAARPGMPIILCTGFSELVNAESAKEIGIREFIMKPLLLDDIASVVRKAMRTA